MGEALVIFPDNPEAMTHFVRCDGIAGPWPAAEQVLSLAEPPRCVAEPRSRLTKRCPVASPPVQFQYENPKYQRDFRWYFGLF